MEQGLDYYAQRCGNMPRPVNNCESTPPKPLRSLSVHANKSLDTLPETSIRAHFSRPVGQSAFKCVAIS